MAQEGSNGKSTVIVAVWINEHGRIGGAGSAGACFFGDETSATEGAEKGVAIEVVEGQATTVTEVAVRVENRVDGRWFTGEAAEEGFVIGATEYPDDRPSSLNWLGWDPRNGQAKQHKDDSRAHLASAPAALAPDESRFR